MDAEMIARLVAPATASALLTNCLVRHLEAKRLISREEFIGFLEATASDLEAQTEQPVVIAAFRSFVKALAADDPSPALH